VAERHFTREEANELLPQVRRLTELMVTHRRALRSALERQGTLLGKVSGNGGGIQPSELAAAAEEVERHAASVGRSVEQIQELGLQVKDLDVGLVDFPALGDGREVLLCWRLGEDAVDYWHGTDEGFSGRKPL
jgi:hypothetical protein